MTSQIPTASPTKKKIGKPAKSRLPLDSATVDALLDDGNVTRMPTFSGYGEESNTVSAAVLPGSEFASATSVKNLETVVERLCQLVGNQHRERVSEEAVLEEVTPDDLRMLDDEDINSDNGIVSVVAEDDLPAVSFVDTVETTTPVYPALASLINRAVVTATTKSFLDDLTHDFPRPSNCEHLTVPVVNQPIWRCLPNHAKVDDIALQRMQSSLAASVTATAAAFTKLKDWRDQPDDLKGVTKLLGDAVLLSSSTLYNLSLKRRDFIKPHLKPELKALCSAHVPVGKELFSNLKDNLQVLNDGAKMMRPSMARGARFQPYSRPTGNAYRGGHGTSASRSRGEFHDTFISRCEILLKNDLSGSRSSVSSPRQLEVEHRQQTQNVSMFAGRLRYFVPAWQNITSDAFVLECLNGLKIKFFEKPIQCFLPIPIKFSMKEKLAIDAEISLLLDKGAIVAVDPCAGQFISNIFVRPKPNGSLRVILNLKKLNEFVVYEHFKNEHLEFILPLIRENSYFASIDLKDAYFLIPVDDEFKKFFRFLWNGQVFEYQCMCFGFSSAPRIFTKCMKPVFSHLHSLAHECSFYLDDSLHFNVGKEQLSSQIAYTLELFTRLGLIPNFEKSCLEPVKQIRHLGFIIDSELMTVKLPKDKIEKIIYFLKTILSRKSVSIRELVRAVGLMVSTFLAVPYGRLHYRALERLKIEALKKSNGSFDALVVLDEPSKEN
jgi:hypothetical protein